MLIFSSNSHLLMHTSKIFFPENQSKIYSINLYIKKPPCVKISQFMHVVNISYILILSDIINFNICHISISN